MSACGHGGCSGLSQEFARRVELELVYTELQELLEAPPSREVFLEEHRRRSETEGRTLALREVLNCVLARTAAKGR